MLKHYDERPEFADEPWNQEAIINQLLTLSPCRQKGARR
jgi:hypothetical protein